MKTRAEGWRAEVEEQERSGESQSEYCWRKGIKKSTFVWRKSQLKSRAEERFVSLTSDPIAELHLSDGVIIKTHIENLSKLLEVLDARRSA